MLKELVGTRKMVSRVGITPVGSAKYRVNRLRFHLLAYAVARKAQLAGYEAEFIIRCDDSDASNTNRSFLEGYLEVLFSLGVSPNLTPRDKDTSGFSLFQSERGELYGEFVTRLMDAQLAFRDVSGAIFFDSEEFSRRFQHIMIDGKIAVSDIAMGNFTVDIKTPLMDKKGQMGMRAFPLMRSNGEYLFNLCSPVDDALLGVTHVVRDRDKLSLLAQQEMVRISLGFPPFKYVHAPLLVTKEGKRFVSDEHYGDATYQDFVARGILPQALVSYLLSGAVGPSERYYSSIDEFAIQADFSQVHQSNTVFSATVLEQHNKKSLELSSREVYEMVLRRFLVAGRYGVPCISDVNPYLLEMVVRMRRGFLESSRIIESLLFPQYDVPERKHAQVLNLVLALFAGVGVNGSSDSYLELITSSGVEYAKSLGISKKEYLQAIRYILTGGHHGCDLHEIVWYLEKSGAIESRLRMAEAMLMQEGLLISGEEE